MITDAWPQVQPLSHNHFNSLSEREKPDSQNRIRFKDPVGLKLMSLTLDFISFYFKLLQYCQKYRRHKFSLKVLVIT